MDRTLKIFIVIFMSTIIISILFIINGCELSEIKKEIAKKEEETLQLTADSLINNMFYVKDPRMNLCYAVSEGFRHKSIAAINCKKIPKRLLIIGKIRKDGDE